MPIIQGEVLEGSTVHTDDWKAYDGLILNGYDNYRVFHSKNQFIQGKSHVNDDLIINKMSYMGYCIIYEKINNSKYSRAIYK